MASPVTCPIMVLKAKEVIVAIDTPLERVLVSNTREVSHVLSWKDARNLLSAGMIQERGPHVELKLKL